jgi:hypothetical protein
MKILTMKTALVLCGILLTGTAYSATISLGYAAAGPGNSVKIEVHVSSEVDLAGVNVRLEYDPAVFSSATVTTEGTLIGAGHIMQFYSPAPGRINAVAWAPAGTQPFGARSGVVFTVILQIDPSAAKGTYPISFTGAGPVILASSGLSDANGNSIPHVVEQGSATVRSADLCDVNGDSQVNAADLILLLRDWHRTSVRPLLDADIDGNTVVDEKDIMILCRDWESN